MTKYKIYGIMFGGKRNDVLQDRGDAAILVFFIRMHTRNIMAERVQT
jgi:hypothetical protein